LSQDPARFLRQAWAAFRRFSLALGQVIATVVLLLFYFTVFVPFAAAVRLFTDPLQIRARSGPSYWTRRDQDEGR